MAFRSWAKEEITAVRDRDGAEYIKHVGEPPDWSHFDFDTTSISHPNEAFPNLSIGVSYGAYTTREHEERQVKTIWRWRPRHVSDLGDFFLDLLPNDVLRLLLREETRVIHSSTYPWDKALYSFLEKWQQLPSFR